MQDLKVALLDWDSPRNPELRLYVEGELYFGTHYLLAAEEGRIKALRDRLPGKTADFIASVLNKGMISRITIKSSTNEGYKSVICFEPHLETALPHPYTKYLARIVEHAESPEWAGPVCRTRLRAQSTNFGDPPHRNHPFTREQVRLCRRLSVAMQKLATL